jgi:hypothetical protein
MHSTVASIPGMPILKCYDSAAKEKHNVGLIHSKFHFVMSLERRNYKAADRVGQDLTRAAVCALKHTTSSNVNIKMTQLADLR